jgi:hypothetical protein
MRPKGHEGIGFLFSSRMRNLPRRAFGNRIAFRKALGSRDGREMIPQHYGDWVLAKHNGRTMACQRVAGWWKRQQQ